MTDTRKAMQQALEAYCTAWEKSFREDNPFHSVTMDAEDRRHIEAGLKAVLAQQELPQKARPDFIAGYDAGMADAKRMALAQQGEPVAPEQVEAAWRAGWAACRDAEYVGKEAEDGAWGMSQTCANADWENAGAAPAAQPVNKLREALERIADPRNTHFAGDAQVVAREALAAAPAAQPQWQPIETAPKDGKRILVIIEGVTRPILATWSDAAWQTIDGNDWGGRKVTHWMPLPPAPKGADK